MKSIDKQERINIACVGIYECAMNELIEEKPAGFRLRTCCAKVYETNGFFVLRSYSTVVAVVEKYTGNLFDVLRYVYGYTATSAQHIAKFRNDYANGIKYTWREIPQR